MADPTSRVRKGTYARDGGRCLSCGRGSALSYQHRQAVGMGGSRRRPGWAEGVTLCAVCNARCEADLQSEALRYGWKVPRWLSRYLLHTVPVFDVTSGCWFVLDPAAPQRTTISHRTARERMREIYGKEAA